MQRPLPSEHRITISEEWLAEWVDYGLREFARYLAQQAAFDWYLVTHHRKEQP